VTKGSLGPVMAPCRIEVAPLTLFIGRQGTGKSLLAQMLYFFRGLPGLVEYELATNPDAAELNASALAGRLVDGLRSSKRRFANLTKPSAAIKWEGEVSSGVGSAALRKLGFNAQYSTRQIQPGVPLRKWIDELKQPRKRKLTALFVPTERLFYSLALGPTSLSVIRAPLILQVFAHWMDIAGGVQDGWEEGPDTLEGRWVRDRLRAELGGEAYRKGSRWMWAYGHAGRSGSIELDLASSGQRANWPLHLLPQVLFTLRREKQLAEHFTLYVEEPEIHLHPSAERAVIDVLAYLVHHGIRVVITTHSLTVLYALNNAVLASKVGAKRASDVVAPELMLQSDQVAAYHLRSDGTVESLKDRESGLLDERALGEVSDDLAAQMNQLYLLGSERE
ncbi:MAG: ATP-binding protein, partial [Sandaracinaceae bacterium]|nr:ATP-binding protein [Sandaracinaceae bacterium]